MSFRQFWLNLMEQYQDYGKLDRNYKIWRKGVRWDMEKKTFVQRYDEEMLRKIAHEPKEKAEPISDEAWFGIFVLITLGFFAGFVGAWVMFEVLGVL